MVEQKSRQIEEFEEKISRGIGLLQRLNQQMNKIDDAITVSNLRVIYEATDETLKLIGTDPKEVEKVLEDMESNFDKISDMMTQHSEYDDDTDNNDKIQTMLDEIRRSINSQIKSLEERYVETSMNHIDILYITVLISIS